MLGNTLALLCALAWSLAVILLKISGAKLHPLALNLLKNLLGLLLLFITVQIVEGGVQWPRDPEDTAWLLLSGFLGIGLADGLVLKAMQHLKASHVAILECLFAPFVIILSIFMLGERPTASMLVGGCMIVASLFFLSPRGSARFETQELRGVLLMTAGLFLIAYGIVAIKPLMDHVPLFSLVTIRMMAGVFGSALAFTGVKDKLRHLSDLRLTADGPTLFLACLFSAYISIILWIAGYKYLQASVAALLNQTSTVFTVLFAVVFLKEKLTRTKLLATLLALTGVLLITLAR